MSTSGDLVFEKRLFCRAEAAYRCWTSSELLRRFIAPAPAVATDALIEPVPGGRISLGVSQPGRGLARIEGCVLHLVPGRRLIWTDALSGGWRPRAEASFTADLTFSDTDSGLCDHRLILRRSGQGPLARCTPREVEEIWAVLTDQLGQLASGR